MEAGLNAIGNALGSQMWAGVAALAVSTVVGREAIKVCHAWLQQNAELKKQELKIRLEAQRQYECINALALTVAAGSSLALIWSVFVAKIICCAAGAAAFGCTALVVTSVVGLNYWLSRHMTLDVGPKWNG